MWPAKWDALGYDILVSIFSRLTPSDLILRAGFVCSAWRAAAADPSSWKRLDLSAEDRPPLLGFIDGEENAISTVLSIAAHRSRGQIEAVLLPDHADERHLTFLAERCPQLRYFSIPNQCMDVDAFRGAVVKFPSLRGMAVHVNFIRPDVLSCISHQCPAFSELKVFADSISTGAAALISDHLPHLAKLDLSYSNPSVPAILTFLEKLPVLEYLDVSGFRRSGVTEEVLRKASTLKFFAWGSGHDLGEFIGCSELGDDEDAGPCECILDRTVMEWLAGDEMPS